MSLVAADALTAEGNELFQAQAYGEAAVRFERATTVYPTHHQAWKGLGHSLLCLGRPADAASDPQAKGETKLLTVSEESCWAARTESDSAIACHPQLCLVRPQHFESPTPGPVGGSTRSDI